MDHEFYSDSECEYDTEEWDFEEDDVSSTDSEDSESSDVDDVFLAENIKQLMELSSSLVPSHRTNKSDVQIEQCGLANASIATDDAMRVYVLFHCPSGDTKLLNSLFSFEFEDTVNDEALEEVLSEEYLHVKAYQDEFGRIRLPPIRRSTPAGISYQVMDLDQLVSLREQHQTRQAASGIRVRAEAPQAVVDAQKQRLLLRTQMEHVLRSEQGNRGVGTGLERYKRWTWRAAARGGRDGLVKGVAAPALPAGSSANASVVATTNTHQVNLR